MVNYSIVAACYKVPDLTEKFLDSIHKYPLPDKWELILIDNDGSKEMKKVLKKYPATIISLGENVGTSRAWNTGMMKAQGKYIIVMNSNSVVTGKDWWKPYEKCISEHIILATCEHMMAIYFMDRRIIDDAHIWYDENIFFGNPDVDLLFQIDIRRRSADCYGIKGGWRYQLIDISQVKVKHLKHKMLCAEGHRLKSIEYYNVKVNIKDIFNQYTELHNGYCTNCGETCLSRGKFCPRCNSDAWWNSR